MKSLSILGSTGSIGTQTLDVVRRNPDLFLVTALSCGRNIDLLKEQIDEFQPEFVAVEREEDVQELRGRYGAKNLRIASGELGLITCSTLKTDLVVNALSGVKGMVPTLAAITSGHDVALANKETLVAGGEIIMNAVEENGVRLLPIDSEHSAIFQCLEGNRNRKIKKIILTASGGPFRGKKKEELEDVTPEDALKHPNWNMGRKITIDSATMMNKGLEVIEAKWLFGVEVDDIEVVIHPESIVHSAVEFRDNAILAQMGTPDMRTPISLALGYPDRVESGSGELSLFHEGRRLTFEEPDRENFRCLDLAIKASKLGKTYPAVMNGANEVLVQGFLDGKIGFNRIPEFIERVMEAHEPEEINDMDCVLRSDAWARREAMALMEKELRG